MGMSNDQIELITKLIEAVSRNAILYDTSQPDYKNTCKKKLVWESIAKEVGGSNGSSMSWKWKNLRDNYAKHRKSITGGADQTVQKFVNWRWAPYMSFLDPHLRRRKELLAPDSEDIEESIYTDIEENIAYVEIPPAPKDRNSPEPSTSTSSTKRRYLEYDDIDSETFQQDNSQYRLDKIDYLFLNYADTYKKLSPRKQALLKLQMAKMFGEAELQEIEINPIKFEFQVGYEN